MRNSSPPLATPPTRERVGRGPDRVPSEDNVSLFGEEITRLLQRQQGEIQHWSQAAGRLFQTEIERAVVQGLAMAFRTLADKLPHLLAEARADAPPSPADVSPTLSIVSPQKPANNDADPPRIDLIPLDESNPLLETAEQPPRNETTKADVAPASVPRVVLPAPGAARAHFRRGLEAARAGDIERAVAHLSESLRLYPKGAAVYLARGQLHRRLGRTEAALEDAEQALRLNPQLAGAYYLRAAAHLRQGKNTQAIADLTHFLEREPDHALALHARGLAHANDGEYGLAIADYGRALRIQPSLLLARYNRALAYRLKGEHAFAVIEFSKVIQLQPANARAFFNRGLARLALDEYDRALEDFDKALELAPGDGEIRIRREEAAQARKQQRAETSAVPEASRRPTPTTPPAPPAEVADADPTCIPFNCLACGAPAQISWKRLNRPFRCRKCSRVFYADREGRFSEVAPTPTASRRMWRLKHVLVPVAALFLVIVLTAWAYPRFHRPPPLPELPSDLPSRGEVWAKAWLSEDRFLLRRLTAPTHDRQLHPWLARHPPPKAGNAASPEQAPPTIRVSVVKNKPSEAVVIVRITARVQKTPVELRLNWIERGETWYFVPSLQR